MVFRGLRVQGLGWVGHHPIAKTMALIVSTMIVVIQPI